MYDNLLCINTPSHSKATFGYFWPSTSTCLKQLLLPKQKEETQCDNCVFLPRQMPVTPNNAVHLQRGTATHLHQNTHIMMAVKIS